MQEKVVKDLMVPLNEYPTVSEEASLYEAVMALEKAQEQFDRERYRHRAILVYNKDRKIVGKVSQWDLIKSLEPKYEKLGEIRSGSRSGLSPEFIRSMMEKYSLWRGNLDAICNRVAEKSVKDFMYRPTEGEKIEEDATLGEALHSFVVGRHQSLLVTKREKIVGILRVTDMFKLVCERIKLCSI